MVKYDYMIRVYCGSDVSKSRFQFFDLKQKCHIDPEYETVEIGTNDFAAAIKSSEYEQFLFASKKIYFVENILSKKFNRDIVMALQNNIELELAIWEENIEPRIIKQYLSKSSIIISDLPNSIWKLLDGIKPGNKAQTIQALSDISDSVDEHLVLYMIQKRVKELIMIYGGYSGNKKMADWQKTRLKSQLSSWKKENLLTMYSKLYNVEKAEKTGTSAYSIKQALEILFCFYL